MKKITLILVVLININYFCFSQQGGRLRRADSLQIEFLTKELTLSGAESEKLFPTYNRYRNEIRTTRRSNADDQIELEEKTLNIRKKYKDEFKSILGSDERVNKLFIAEKNFSEMLRKELMKRRLNRQ